MGKMRNIAEGLITFVSGVLFAYFTYPFFTALFDAITDTSGIFEGWDTIRYLMWAGYIGIVVAWIVVVPAYKMFLPTEQ